MDADLPLEAGLWEPRSIYRSRQFERAGRLLLAAQRSVATTGQLSTATLQLFLWLCAVLCNAAIAACFQESVTIPYYTVTNPLAHGYGASRNHGVTGVSMRRSLELMCC